MARGAWKIPGIAKAFLALVFMECVFLLVVCILGLVGEHDKEEGVASVLCMLMIVGFFYFSLDSIIKENIFQFWVSMVTHTLIFIYAIWNYLYYRQRSEFTCRFFCKVSLPVMIAVCVIQAVHIASSYFIQSKFGWRIYKKVGGDAELQSIYRTYQIFCSVLRIDLFVDIIVLAMVGFYFFTDTLSLVLSICCLVFSFGWTWLGLYAVRREGKNLMYIFQILAVIEPAIIVVRLYQLHDQPQYPLNTFEQFIITGTMACITRIGVLAFSFRTSHNFHKGLKEKVLYSIRKFNRQSVPTDRLYVKHHYPPVSQ